MKQINPSLEAFSTCDIKILSLSILSFWLKGPFPVKSLNSLYAIPIKIFWSLLLISSHTEQTSGHIRSSLCLTSKVSLTNTRSLLVSVPCLLGGKKVLNPLIENGFFSSKCRISVSDTPRVVSKYGDYKNSDGTSSDSKSGDYLTIIY